MTLVVVGGGPAGLAAAQGYRAAGGTGLVTMLAAEARLPYRRPPLTKEYLRGELDEGELPLEQPGWFDEHDVRLVRGAPAVALDLERRVVVADGLGELAFESLIVATGARPSRPPIDGLGDPRVHVIRTVSDADALCASVHDGTPRVAVVGSGFIGCEAAASLAMRGAEVTLVTDEPAPQAARLGEEVAERIGGWLTEVGVRLRAGSSLAGIDAAAGSLTLRLESGGSLEADVVLLALGIEPNAELAYAAGLVLEDGRIACGAGGATNVEGVFAAGDVARLHNAAAGRRLTVEHWGEALAQGEIAGRSAAGAEAEWDAVPGFWSTIGIRTLKQAAWGDRFDEVRLEDHGPDAWSAWYVAEGRCVGVLSHNRDDDYERAQELLASGEPAR